VLAIELSRRGRGVVLVEGGGSSFEARSQDLYAGESTGLLQTGLYNGRYRVLGGTTTRWGGQVLEIDEHVFSDRPGVQGGRWPFPKRELESAYKRASELEGLTGAQCEADAIWRQLGLAQPQFGEELSSAFSRWCPETNFARIHRRVLQQQAGLTVYLHANVCGLQLAADGQTVVSARAATLTGKHVDFRARTFVLAMGGIETCRLLLQPMTTGCAPSWAASRWLGQHFQDHISCFTATLREESLPPRMYFDYVSLGGFKYHPKIKLRPETQAKLGTLDVCGTVALTSDGVDDVAMAYETLRFWQARQVRNLTPKRIAHFALNAHKLLWHRMPYARRGGSMALNAPLLRLNVHCEQTPLSAGRITLIPERDALGLQRVRVEWRASALELYSIRRFLNVVRDNFRVLGLGRIIPDPGIEDDDGVLTAAFQESFHHMGGTRMAESAAEGVVDPNLRIFGTTNAFICSTSVLPSTGFANPTHTLLALAVRLASHLAQRSVG
jgi:choline dehydrogenase-like flavoprotein